MLVIAFNGHAHAQATSIAKTFTSTGSSVVIAPKQTQFNYHTLFFQAAGLQVSGGSASNNNTDKIYICFNTANQCSPANAAIELAPGDSFGPITVGMYTGLSGQQLSGSILFNSDISFISASGTQYVHALID